MAVYSENQTEYINTLWGQNNVLLNTEAGGAYGYQRAIKRRDSQTSTFCLEFEFATQCSVGHNALLQI